MSLADAGSYSCTLKNAFGQAATSLKLGCAEKGKLEQAPKFTTHLSVRLFRIKRYRINYNLNDTFTTQSN